MNKLLSIAACVYLATASFSNASTLCKVVYDGDMGVLEHEIAHCNGWTHSEPDPNSTVHQHERPPIQYRHKYPNLRVYKSHGLEVAKVCEKVTGEAYDTPYLKTVRGCATGGKIKAY